MVGYSEHSVNASSCDFGASPEGVSSGTVGTWKTAPCANEAPEL